MVGNKNRQIDFAPMVNYYELCEECLAKCMAWQEAGADPNTRPDVCKGCPFEDDDT